MSTRMPTPGPAAGGTRLGPMAVPDALLADLTPPQAQAVTHRDGPLLVLAGPGSGKTTVVTRRVACLIAGGVPPWQILALTFTNKAAAQMRQRIALLLGPAAEETGAPTVATFHSFCARQLRRHAPDAGIAPGFSIYDTADQRDAIKQAIERSGVSTQNFSPASIAARISDAKNRLLDARAFAERAEGFYDRTVARLFKGYEEILRAHDALDFDDLLVVLARLLRDAEAVRRRLQERFRYLLVDEYQDTNHAQFVIAHTLAAARRNICVVGDPDQSIYRWRGADVGNILEFEEHYPDAVVVPLGRNFRSTGHIVAAAAGLIRHNRNHRHKDLHTELGEGLRPEVVIRRDEHHEAGLVADFLARLHRVDGVPWREMAVLYRVNALSRVLEQALRSATIPYVIARGTAFYERKEVKEALSYLRLLVNPADEASLRRVINTPPRGIGGTTLSRLEVFAIDRQVPLLAALRRAGEIADLGSRAQSAVAGFVRLVDRFRGTAVAPAPATVLDGDRGGGAATERRRGPLADLVAQVLQESGLLKMYSADTEEERQRRENLEELISAAAEHVPLEAGGGGAPVLDALGSFLESVALVSDADMIDPERGSVTLLTLHAAKGLEFEAVAIVGLEEGLLPHARAAESEADLEEERRLCYVGMTRAKRRLLLSRAVLRTHRGFAERTMQSRFLDELPRQSVVISDQGDLAAIDEPDAAERERRRGGRGDRVFEVGCIVRHPKFGLGTVESIMHRASSSSARVNFRTVGVRTLVLDVAPLERVD